GDNKTDISVSDSKDGQRRNKLCSSALSFLQHNFPVKRKTFYSCHTNNHQPPDDTSHHVLRWHATALPVFTRINRYQNTEQ
ncbi:hypothetical protein KX458_26575, partial [Escherichia coli]|nr:hypothetical protein [Escherichia coli]